LCGDADTGRDAVQDGFAQAIRSRAGFRGEGSLEGWVWRIVLNAGRRRRPVSLAAVPEPVGAPASAGGPDIEFLFAMARGFMLTVVFDRTLPSSTPVRREPTLGRAWASFATGNCLTFFHPLSLPPRLNARGLLALPRRQQVRVLMRHSKEGRADHLKSRTAWMVFHLMRALGRTR
jgi:hypothetical protein